MLREITNFDEISKSYYKAGMTPEQCRAARAWLGWSQQALAAKAQVSSSTVLDFEGGRRVPHANNLAAMRRALEDAGIRFQCAEDGSPRGIGVAPKSDEKKKRAKVRR
jgi:ribosome-binding protein aMBF1 (putative translation factor)